MLIRRCALSLCLLAGSAAANGPDVTLQDIPDVFNFGQVGSVYGYAIGSATCNIGNLNLLWNSAGTPGLAMNAYRLHDGRLVQIGLGFCKTACCAAAGSGCGSCNGQGGGVLGAGCKDVYSAGWNGGQSFLGPRSAINGFNGAFTSFSGASGNAIYKRLQINTADLNTTTYPNAQYFVEGVYVGTDDAVNGNGLNNATYKRVSLGAGGNLSPLVGTQQSGIPAIKAWRDHGLGIGQPDTSVTVATLDVPEEGRFWYATKPKDLGNGTWRYEYAVFNLNSDASGASFSVNLPIGVDVANVGFSAPAYHSGEVYSNAPWVVTVGPTSVKWSCPETFAQNINASALRWGTMYNFWFEATTPPGTGIIQLGLFKPVGAGGLSFSGLAPSAPTCYANCDPDTTSPILNVNDFSCFLNKFAGAKLYANCDGSTTAPWLNVQDFACFLNKFATGCS